MKKSELTQLTQVIEHIVAREIRKQLPKIISEVFQNGLNKPILEAQTQPKQLAPAPIQEDLQQDDMKTSLRELFSGVSRVEDAPMAPQSQAKPEKQYTKNPILNKILNETTADLRQRDRFMSPAAAMAGYATTPIAMAQNPAEMAGGSIPVGRPPVLTEGQESTHAPLSAIPDGISALDVAKAGMTPAPVAEALTNYSRMKAVLDASKKRR